jgi:ABC-2 type transport system permease protein
MRKVKALMRLDVFFRNIIDTVVLFYSFSKVAFLTQLEFRITYAVRMLGKVFSFGSGFAIIAILLNRFKAIGNWSTYEVLFLYSMNIFCYSLGATFTMPFANLSSRINRGLIDSILTKPVNAMLFYMCQNISAGYTSNYVIGIGIMILSLSRLDIAWSLPLAVHFIFSIIGGTLIHASALIACGVPAFWLVKGRAITNILYEDLSKFVDYPLSIYSRFIQFLLTFVLPYAFINFYPAQVLLGKSDSIFVPGISYFSPVIGAIAFFLAYQFWLVGLRAYQSTGS